MKLNYFLNELSGLFPDGHHLRSLANGLAIVHIKAHGLRFRGKWIYQSRYRTFDVLTLILSAHPCLLGVNVRIEASWLEVGDILKWPL